MRGQGAPGALGVRVGWSGSSGTRQGGPGWDTIPDADAPGCRREGEPSEGVRGGSVSALSWPGLGCTGCLSHGAGSRGPVPPRAPQTPGGFAVGSHPITVSSRSLGVRSVRRRPPGLPGDGWGQDVSKGAGADTLGLPSRGPHSPGCPGRQVFSSPILQTGKAKLDLEPGGPVRTEGAAEQRRRAAGTCGKGGRHWVLLCGL